MHSESHLAATPAGPWGGILLVYFSTHGHTALVAECVAAALRRHGLDVDLSDIAHAGDVDPERHDVVVVGASLHREPERAEIVTWITQHRAALAGRPTALFSVSLVSAGEHEGHLAARRTIDALGAQSGWRPDRAVTIADPRMIDRLVDEIAVLVAAPLAA